MSYSFGVKKQTKAEAIEAVAAELDKVVSSQPIHAADRDQALATATAFINLLPDDGTKDISISVSGSVSWTGNGTAEPQRVTGASVNANAYLAAREQKAAA